MSRIESIKVALAHETRDGQPVVGLDGWRAAFIRAFSAVGGGCTLAEATGAYVHANGSAQVGAVTVFETYYPANSLPYDAYAALVELVKRYGREAEQASVLLIVGDRAIQFDGADFDAARPLAPPQSSIREELSDIAAYFEGGRGGEVGA